MDTLRIHGLVASGGVDLAHRDLASIPNEGQVADVGVLAAGKVGKAVRLSALLAKAGPGAAARYLNAASSDPSFAVTLPLADVAERALVVYELDGAPLPAKKGGPFRLLVPGHPDECVNVKQLASLELSDRPGRDTRPTDDAEHAKMHANKACGELRRPPA